MKFLKFLLPLGICTALFYTLNTNWGSIPALGPLLSPFTGYLQNGERDGFQYSEELKLEGLKDEVIILYDSFHIPHIFTNNKSDLYFAQGYITASHRLWQMELQTHAAAGRVSEILGKRALAFDRGQRRKGMLSSSKEAMEFMMSNPITEEALTAYSSGVNAFIESLAAKDLPIEYKLLGSKPEKWSPLKSALLLKYMSDALTGKDYDVELSNALHILGAETFKEIYPIYPKGIDPITKNNFWDTMQVDASINFDSTFYPFKKNISAPEIDPDNGSNNWAVGGSRTKTGYPLLANDPHLDLNLPSLWYEIQLTCRGEKVYGASLPGSPGVVSGFNDEIAWGVTNAQRDVKDWYAIRFAGDDNSLYRYDTTYLKPEKNYDTIHIKGGEIFIDTQLITKFGVIVYDQKLPGDSTRIGYALRWLAHEKSNELLTFLKLNEARNYSDYRQAISHFVCPGQNFVFASQSNDIAITQSGIYPLRRPYQGVFVQDGTKSSNIWTGFIPNGFSPFELNPMKGFVSSANQHPTDSSYPFFYTGNFEYFRNRRINQVLGDTNKKFGIEDMMALQNDNKNLIAEEAIPYIIDAIEGIQEYKEVHQILSTWNLINASNEIGASVFEVLWDAFKKITFDELYESGVAIKEPKSFVLLGLLNDSLSHPIFDLQETELIETQKDIIQIAVKYTINTLGKDKLLNESDSLKWGLHQLTRVEHLAKLKPFGRYDILTGGNHEIVNAMKANHGPSWRMIVAFDKDAVGGYGSYPGGQSGNPGSPNYTNILDIWIEGKYHKFEFLASPNGHAKNAFFTQKLKP